MICRILNNPNGPTLHVHGNSLSVADLKRFSDLGWSIFTTGCISETPAQVEQGSSSKAQGYSKETTWQGALDHIRNLLAG